MTVSDGVIVTEEDKIVAAVVIVKEILSSLSRILVITDVVVYNIIVVTGWVEGGLW